MTPTARPRGLALALIVTAMACTTPALAEKADREKEIQVLADRLTADDAKREAVYDGNVIITQGTLRITAARITVREDAEGYRTYVATGSPVTFRQKRDKVDEWVDGEAKRAEFEDRTELLKLFEAARLKSPQGELTGDFISYDRGKEFVEVTGAPGSQPGAPPSRVKATIVPPKKDPEAAATKQGTPKTGAPKAGGSGTR